MAGQRYLLLFLCLFMLGLQSAYAAVEVYGARYWESAEKARLVLDVAAPVKYQVERANNDILVSIKDAVLLAPLPSVAGHSKILRNVEALSRSEKHVAIRLETTGSAAVKTFTLRPAGPYGYRLVLDVIPDAGARQDAAITKEKVASDAADPDLTGVVPPANEHTWLIAIDPGHGGTDPGAVGPDGAYEKNVTLAIARDLAKRISRTPGMKAMLTRNGDYFVPLWERTKRARQAGADLFISIHADASPSGYASGASVYTLSLKGASDQAAAMLANKENQADLVGGVKLADKDNVLASVLLDLSQTATMSASQLLASDVLHQLSDIGRLHRTHFGQAGFVVLKSPDIPSILVETGFITHRDEERRLTSSSYQHKIADAIFRGIGEYIARYEGVKPNTVHADARTGEKELARVEAREGKTAR